MRAWVAALALMVSATACGGGGAAPAGSTVSTSTGPAATGGSTGGAAPVRAGPLAAGTYSLVLPGSTVRFVLGEGWQATNAAPNVGVVLLTGDPSDLRALSLFVVPVSQADAVSLIENTEGLSVETAAPATVGGLTGDRIDVTVGGAAGKRIDVIGIGNPTVDVFFVLGGERASFIALSAGGATIVIAVVSQGGVFEDFLPTAEAVIDSMTFA